MPLCTKSILQPESAADGIRVCVMSRLTPDHKKHPYSTFGSYHEWRKVIAPPEPLFRKLHEEQLSWDEFETAYRAYLRNDDIRPHVFELARTALHATMTILCIEEDLRRSPRRILAEECKRLVPNLPVTHS